MSATPGRSGLRAGARERAWWLVLVVVAVALVVLAWGPWQRGSAAVEPPLAGATSDEPAQETLAQEVAPETEAEQSAPSPEPSLTRTSNTRPATPSVPSGQFDDRTAQGLFLSAEQLAAAVPTASDATAPAPNPAAGWGLPAGAIVTPSECRVAATVVDAAPSGFSERAWAGQQVRFGQEVVLLPGSADARRAFAALVGTVDACPEYHLGAADGSGSVWDAQPAIEGQGLFPSIVQQVTVDDGSGAPENGYRGHLLVGNAIVSWTARTTGAAALLGPPESLADVVQERALAAVRSLG